MRIKQNKVEKKKTVDKRGTMQFKSVSSPLGILRKDIAHIDKEDLNTIWFKLFGLFTNKNGMKILNCYIFLIYHFFFYHFFRYRSKRTFSTTWRSK